LLTSRGLSRIAVVAATGAVTLLAAGCGASAHHSAPPPSVPASSAPSASSPGGTAAGGAPADPAAATAAIKADWSAFFAAGTPRARALSLLQDGAALGPALAAAAALQAKTKISESATVTAVTFTSPTTAAVSWQLKSGTSVLLPDASGQAVFTGGTWKVSKNTFCALVALGAGGKAVPGC
jgi:hypothetical protein